MSIVNVYEISKQAANLFRIMVFHSDRRDVHEFNCLNSICHLEGFRLRPFVKKKKNQTSYSYQQSRQTSAHVRRFSVITCMQNQVVSQELQTATKVDFSLSLRFILLKISADVSISFAYFATQRVGKLALSRPELIPSRMPCPMTFNHCVIATKLWQLSFVHLS